MMTNKIRRLSGLMLLVLMGSLVLSLFGQDSWLWMDEITSSVLLADPSIGHMNQALVSGLDSHPPLFFNLFWLVSHAISLNPIFLKALSIGFFSLAICLFYRFTTRLTGNPTINFILFTAIISLTYLNYILATEIRTYSTYLLISSLYFVIIYQLLQAPATPTWLAGFLLTGVALMFVNNFGSFYLAASLAFFGLIWWWSRQWRYGLVVAMHLLVISIWFVLWYPSSQIQAEAGQPHSWIPVPTFWTTFQILGELLPAFPYRLERWSGVALLPLLRVIMVVGLFFYLVLPKLKTNFEAFQADHAFSMYVLSGFMILLTSIALLVVSLTYMSVFISRCLWPNHLLLLYQLAYAGQFVPQSLKLRWQSQLTCLLPFYTILLSGFMLYRGQKATQFATPIRPYLRSLGNQYPVFFESADYFLPVWYYKPVKAYFLLDWPTAVRPGNALNATVDYNILQSLRDYYQVTQVIPAKQFTKGQFPHFYVVDEASRYQIEAAIATRQVRIVRVIPTAISGCQLLECRFN